MVGVLRCCDDLRFCTWLDSEKVLNFSYIYIYIYKEWSHIKWTYLKLRNNVIYNSHHSKVKSMLIIFYSRIESNVMLWITLKNDVLKKEVNKNDIIWHYFGLGGFLSLLKVK